MEHACHLVNNKIRIHKFKQLKLLLVENILVVIHKGIVECIIDYGIFIWGATYGKHLNQLTFT